MVKVQKSQLANRSMAGSIGEVKVKRGSSGYIPKWTGRYLISVLREYLETSKKSTDY